MAKPSHLSLIRGRKLFGKVAVIGGGWAGFAAALELARHGVPVKVFERGQELGGRARKLVLHDKALDNGQHILLGAYSQSLALMEFCGIDLTQHLLRLPLQMPYPPRSLQSNTPSHQAGMQFIAPRWPAPLHLLGALLRAQGLSWVDKLALARFSTTARWQGWQLAKDCSVSELLQTWRQPDNLVQLLWRPLCLAALNTPLENASAQVFLNVLRDSLGAARAASDMLLSKTDLSTLFPETAARTIFGLGGEVFTGTTIDRIQADGAGWKLLPRESAHQFGPMQEIALEETYASVIIATPPQQAAHLLQPHCPATQLNHFSYQAITTCYLQYAPQIKLARPFFALRDDEKAQRWGQFVFDRGQLMPDQAGLLAVIISAATQVASLPQAVLAQQIAQQLATDFADPQLAQPLWHQVISEKRATFACDVGLQRPDNATALESVFLAGDYTRGDYPATLEAATRSGVRAAQLLLNA